MSVWKMLDVIVAYLPLWLLRRTLPASARGPKTTRVVALGDKTEVRYELFGAKYRAVYRDGRPMDGCVPPLKPMGFARAPRLVRATCLCSETGDYDVTARVRKYLGPMRDFHASAGLVVTAWDLFPSDDPEFEAKNVRALALEWANATGGDGTTWSSVVPFTRDAVMRAPVEP